MIRVRNPYAVASTRYTSLLNACVSSRLSIDDDEGAGERCARECVAIEVELESRRWTKTLRMYLSRDSKTDQCPTDHSVLFLSSTTLFSSSSSSSSSFTLRDARARERWIHSSRRA